MLEVRIGLHHGFGSFLRLHENRVVANKMRETQVVAPMLARSHKIARAAPAQVLLGNGESVVCARQNFQLLGGLGVGRDENAIRLLRAAADTAPQLMKLRQSESL